MISIDELRKCKNATPRLISMVRDRLDSFGSYWDETNHLEDDFDFDFDDVRYGVTCVEESDWDDEGKYQYQNNVYQLVSYDPSVAGYPCTKNITSNFNLFFELSVKRSGSYFSDYYYQYDCPTIQIASEKIVPEQVIPSHSIVEFNVAKE